MRFMSFFLVNPYLWIRTQLNLATNGLTESEPHSGVPDMYLSLSASNGCWPEWTNGAVDVSTMKTIGYA